MARLKQVGGGGWERDDEGRWPYAAAMQDLRREGDDSEDDGNGMSWEDGEDDLRQEVR